jgi:hypothetical protein
MVRVARLLSIVGIVGMTLSSGSSAAGMQVEGDLVDAILSRAEVILSGRMTYRVSDVNNLDSSCKFTFSGSSWRIDDLAFHVDRINHRGDFVEVRRTPQPDGTIRNSARFSTERSREDQMPYPPHFAGSLWYLTGVEYIRSHKKGVRYAGAGDIQKISCSILEWSVSREDRFRAFGSIVSPLNGGGLLRLYASKALGYALPRIDYLAPDGELAIRFESSDFREVAGGIFIPGKILMSTFPGKDQRGYSLEYKIGAVDGINEPIPDDAFVVSLPEGTRVSDVRRERTVNLIVGDLNVSFGEIARVDANSSTKRRWGGALGRGLFIGLNGVLIMIAAVWMFRKKRTMA